MPPERPLLIGELAKQAGVKPDSVRFYERNNLLPKPQRSANGYRVYDEAALNRLKFIKRAQALGFSLDEIRRILNLRGQGNETCRCVVSMAEATLAETERKLAELSGFADALRSNLTRWRRAPKGRPIAAEFCKLIETAEVRERST